MRVPLAIPVFATLLSQTGCGEATPAAPGPTRTDGAGH